MQPASNNTKPDPSYGMTARLPGITYAAARAAITEALKEEGFGILTEIDVQATLKKKLDQEFRPYVILGACNPSLAHQALSMELGIGLLLPCNVCVWEDELGAVVSIAKPAAMFEVVGNAALAPLVDDATARLQRALEQVQRSGKEPSASP